MCICVLCAYKDGEIEKGTEQKYITVIAYIVFDMCQVLLKAL